MAGLAIDQVRKAFGATPVLRDVSLHAAPGSFVVIVGPSGCGKTTLLRSLAGLESVDAGTVALDGRDITDLSPAARNIAMVFQNYALYPTKSVRENIAFGLRQRRMPREEIRRRIADAGETLQIGHLLDRRPSQLSGGQRQRVAIGRAMVREPALFLFDEPLSNLDAGLRNDLRIEIKRIHNRMGTISVFVTHDQLEAMSLADVLVVMREGRIEQIGAPYDVFRRPANKFVAGFIGTPAMHFLAARADTGHAVLDGGARLAMASLAGLPDGTAIEIGVRPDDVDLVTPDTATLPGRVDVTQELGTNRLVRVTTGAGDLSVLQSAHEPRPAGPVGIRLAPDRALVFLRDTGEVLG